MSEATDLTGCRVLVVEDEFVVALNIQQVLQQAGCVVIGPASRLEAALPLVDAEPLDAAVVDLNLAGELAWPVVERLEQRAVPFVVVTGYGGPFGKVAMPQGAVSLAKPIDHAVLLAALREAIELARAASLDRRPEAAPPP